MNSLTKNIPVWRSCWIKWDFAIWKSYFNDEAEVATFDKSSLEFNESVSLLFSAFSKTHICL